MCGGLCPMGCPGWTPVPGACLGQGSDSRDTSAMQPSKRACSSMGAQDQQTPFRARGAPAELRAGTARDAAGAWGTSVQRGEELPGAKVFWPCHTDVPSLVAAQGGHRQQGSPRPCGRGCRLLPCSLQAMSCLIAGLLKPGLQCCWGSCIPNGAPASLPILLQP